MELLRKLEQILLFPYYYKIIVIRKFRPSKKRKLKGICWACGGKTIGEFKWYAGYWTPWRARLFFWRYIKLGECSECHFKLQSILSQD